jgi:hypothetical protein
MPAKYDRKDGPMNACGMKIMACLLIWVCATACATTSDIVRAKAQGKGTSRVYPLNVEKAWEISKTVFRFEGQKEVDEHRSEGYMVARTGESTMSSGALVGVWIEAVDGDNTRVTVVIKRRDPTELSVQVTETDFHENFVLAWRMYLKKSGSKP